MCEAASEVGVDLAVNAMSHKRMLVTQIFWQAATPEPRQFKNNLIMFESKLISKLPPFSLNYTVGEKKAAISK